MKLLITNDDGIKSEGLNILYNSSKKFFSEIWIIAPNSEMSQVGHSVSKSKELSFTLYSDKKISVNGTPVDCVRSAITYFMKNSPPDYIFSGVNNGANLGLHDYYVSGTISAVREGIILGIPGIAFSCFFLDNPLDYNKWSKVTPYCEEVIKTLLEKKCSKESFWNVNFPEINNNKPTIKYTKLDTSPYISNYTLCESNSSIIDSSNYKNRITSNKMSDMNVCFRGNISITKIRI